jgi:hypothetical protein
MLCIKIFNFIPQGQVRVRPSLRLLRYSASSEAQRGLFRKLFVNIFSVGKCNKNGNIVFNNNPDAIIACTNSVC